MVLEQQMGGGLPWRLVTGRAHGQQSGDLSSCSVGQGDCWHSGDTPRWAWHPGAENMQEVQKEEEDCGSCHLSMASSEMVGCDLHAA
jgi:hypothetical protein